MSKEVNITHLIDIIEPRKKSMHFIVQDLSNQIYSVDDIIKKADAFKGDYLYPLYTGNDFDKLPDWSNVKKDNIIMPLYTNFVVDSAEVIIKELMSVTFKDIYSLGVIEVVGGANV